MLLQSCYQLLWTLSGVLQRLEGLDAGSIHLFVPNVTDLSCMKSQQSEFVSEERAFAVFSSSFSGKVTWKEAKGAEKAALVSDDCISF